HFGEWLVRLGDGTDESRRRAQAGLDALWMYTGEMFEGLADPVRKSWDQTIGSTLDRSTLTRPPSDYMQSGGRSGRHSEHLGYIPAEMQFLQRAYPGAAW